jgi:hypothetical protein
MTRVGRGATSNLSANVFGVAVIDILDYADASKNTTARGLTGVDNNGSGFIYIGSGLYTATSAVTSISLNPDYSFVQHTTAALFGVKAP